MTPEAQLEQVKQELEALQSLVHHPGWAIMTARIKAQAAVQMSGMRNAKTQDELLKHTYTYMALADLPDAPNVLIKVLAQRLQTTKK